MQMKLCYLYAKNGGDIVAVRLFNILGYGVPSALVAGKFSRDISLIENPLATA